MQIFVTNRAFNMFKIELENRDFRKSLYFYIVDAGKKRKKRCWHYSKSRANINDKVDTGTNMRALASAPIYIQGYTLLLSIMSKIKLSVVPVKQKLQQFWTTGLRGNS